MEPLRTVETTSLELDLKGGVVLETEVGERTSSSGYSRIEQGLEEGG